MATTEDKVMKMVEKELRQNPDVSNEELFKKAKDVDSSVEDLSLRQFHAKYPLQVKRRLAPKRPRSATRRRRRSRKKDVDREAIRQSLLRFAKDVSAAEGKAETIDVLSNVDRYVEELVEGVGGG